MILRRLLEYADTRMDLPPVMYGETPVRWFIELSSDGEFGGFVPLGGDARSNKRGEKLIVPQTDRTSGVRANLLVDNGEYVLGVSKPNSKPERVEKCRYAFLDLVRYCAEKSREPSVEAVVEFLESWSPDGDIALPEDFDPSLNLTFRVEGVIPATELESVQNFWEAYTSGSLGSGAERPQMTCLVTGQLGPVEETLPGNIKGIPGGQTSGTALVSANKEPFTSYGLKRAMTSPISKSAGERFNKALNHLLADRKSRIRIGPLAYVFWTREESDFGLDLMSDPDPQRVRSLFESPYTGTEQYGIRPNEFYALALSASGGRAVVRDWLETTVPEAAENLKRWFRAQRVVNAYGERADILGLYPLAASAYRDATSEMTPQVPAALIRAAIKGGRLADDLLIRAVRRNRTGTVLQNGTREHVTRARAALMKLVLSYGRGGEVLTDTLERLDPNYEREEKAAYNCGRLLAELEDLQRAAIPGVKATLVDRYYGSASSTPASVFGNLMRNHQAHISKLRKERRGAAVAIQDRIAEITASIGERFPNTLTMRGQAIFALGYYHQRAHNRAERNKNREEGA